MGGGGSQECLIGNEKQMKNLPSNWLRINFPDIFSSGVVTRHRLGDGFHIYADLWVSRSFICACDLLSWSFSEAAD